MNQALEVRSLGLNRVVFTGIRLLRTRWNRSI